MNFAKKFKAKYRLLKQVGPGGIGSKISLMKNQTLSFIMAGSKLSAHQVPSEEEKT